MRSRAVTVPTALAGLVVTALTLTACQTNVGSAATINGQRISESQVTSYLTADASPVTGTTGTPTPIRSYVLDVLIEGAFVRSLLAATPNGLPSEAERAKLERQLLAGRNLRSLLARNGIKGFSDSLNKAIVDAALDSELLSREQQDGVDVTKYEAKLTFRVSVNPRYGAYDAKTRSLNTSAGAGVPDYLTLQPATS